METITNTVMNRLLQRDEHLDKLKKVRDELKSMENPIFHLFGCASEGYYSSDCNCGVGQKQNAFKQKQIELETLLDQIE